jgi:hypothetical protein
MDESTKGEGWHLLPKYLAGAAIGALVFIGLPESARWLHGGAFAQAQSQQIPSGPTMNGNCNNVGNNNTNCNTFVTKPPPRSIDEAFRGLIRTNFPDKSKEIAPMVLVGDDEPERTNLCVEIESFLKSEGYKVRQRTYFLSPGGTPHGIVIDQYTDPKAIIIKVGVNDRT